MKIKKRMYNLPFEATQIITCDQLYKQKSAKRTISI